MFLKVELIKYFLTNCIKGICKFGAVGTDEDCYAIDPGSIRQGGTMVFFFDIFFLQTCTAHTSILRAGVCRAQCVHLSALHS